jgi:hypothetical protein
MARLDSEFLLGVLLADVLAGLPARRSNNNVPF